MSERLEEIKEYIDSFDSSLDRDDINKFLNDVQNFYDNGYFVWLYDQAVLTEYFGEKNAELNNFLQKYSDPKHLGKKCYRCCYEFNRRKS